jgi:hypothetical protein
MAGNAGINSRHHATPFVADLVKIRVADAAEEDFDLNILGLGSTALNGMRA